MMCNTTIPDQLEIYKQLEDNMATRHKSTFIGISEFNKEFYHKQSIQRQSYNLYTDPYDNQGIRKSYNVVSTGSISHPSNSQQPSVNLVRTLSPGGSLISPGLN